jgi:hypothetical protein
LDGIVAGLVKRGYMVGSAAQNGKPTIPTSEDSPATLIALSLYRGDPSKDVKVDANTVYTDVLTVFTEMGVKYLSIVICTAGDAAWIGSNFSIPAPVMVLPEPPPAKKTDPNMN